MLCRLTGASDWDVQQIADDGCLHGNSHPFIVQFMEDVLIFAELDPDFYPCFMELGLFSIFDNAFLDADFSAVNDFETPPVLV